MYVFYWVENIYIFVGESWNFLRELFFKVFFCRFWKFSWENTFLPSWKIFLYKGSVKESNIDQIIFTFCAISDEPFVKRNQLSSKNFPCPFLNIFFLSFICIGLANGEIIKHKIEKTFISCLCIFFISCSEFKTSKGSEIEEALYSA